MTDKQLDELKAYLNQEQFAYLQTILNNIYAQMLGELTDDKNLSVNNWEYFSDYIIGGQKGFNLLQHIFHKLRTRPTKNTPKKMARYKGMVSVFSKFMLSLLNIKNNIGHYKGRKDV